jgi:hypothetical protein
MTSSASSGGTSTPPRARNSPSITSESAWFTRQPKVTME